MPDSRRHQLSRQPTCPACAPHELHLTVCGHTSSDHPPLDPTNPASGHRIDDGRPMPCPCPATPIPGAPT